MGGYRGPPEDDHGGSLASTRPVAARPVCRDPRHGRGANRRPCPHSRPSGRRAAGPPVVALFDRATGDQRWANEALFAQTEAPKKGLGGLMQRLVTAASEATALEVLQAGPDMIVVHTLMGLRALDARTGAV